MVLVIKMVVMKEICVEIKEIKLDADISSGLS